jgi:hypothetical protein
MFYAQPLFRLVSQACQTLGIHLPIEITESLDRYRSKEWTVNAANMVSSRYIVDEHCTATGVEHRSIDTIVASWEALTIEDRSETEDISKDSKDARQPEG